MDININIQAPGLEQAINNLAQSLSNKGLTEAGTVELPQQQPEQQQELMQQSDPAQQQAPVQQPKAVPTQQQQAPAQQPAPQQQGAVPTSNPEYDMNQLAVAATQLMDAGKQQDLMALLGEFGVQALTQLPKEQYGAFATKLREKGAKI